MKNNKSLGQHWLKNRAILDQIAFFAVPEDAEDVICLEVGPGLGTLTSALLRHFRQVIAVEYDENLAKNLPKSFPGKNLTVLHQDFLDFDFSSLDQPYVVAANIPYYITSPIINKLLSAPNLPRKIVLLIQKEVAERISARGGKHTVLSLSVQNCAQVELGPVVGRELFTPPPKVDSQIIILTPREAPLIPVDTFKFIKRCFSSPRKKLSHNLPSSRQDSIEILSKLGIDISARPSDLSLSQWKTLADFYHNR